MSIWSFYIIQLKQKIIRWQMQQIIKILTKHVQVETPNSWVWHLFCQAYSRHFVLKCITPIQHKTTYNLTINESAPFHKAFCHAWSKINHQQGSCKDLNFWSWYRSFPVPSLTEPKSVQCSPFLVWCGGHIFASGTLQINGAMLCIHGERLHA
jgi:hypothetical protein